MNAVVLKKGKEKVVKQRHHWLFSGAIASFPKDYKDGTIVPIVDHHKKFLAFGFFNRASSLCGRIISFEFGDIHLQLNALFKKASFLRQKLFGKTTTAYRLINAEGDGLPGLIIDRYGPYLVIQIGALGMVKLKPWIIDWCIQNLEIKGIYEKSHASSLKEEGIAPFEGVLWGDIPQQIEILENGNRFLVSLQNGQKTGFFLDHREMRKTIGLMAANKRVLNAFCYTGGFTVAALKNQAARVDSVDISQEALQLCHDNVVLNDFNPNEHGFYKADVFQFLRNQPLEYDLVILDPPAFAKKKGDIPNASRGYKEINRLAFEKMPSGSLLLTCSCSYHITPSHFQKILIQAAHDAKRTIQIVGHHQLAQDHPLNPFHPETEYLKSLLIYIS